MGKWLMRLWAVLLAAVVLLVTGCPPKAAQESPTSKPPAAAKPPVEDETAAAVNKKPIPIQMSETLKTLDATPATIPQVQLPQAFKDACVVDVGDTLPEGEVLTIDGEKKHVAGLLGKKGTVVFFWGVGGSETADQLAVQSLADLEGDAHAPYADQGLAVIAITPNAPPEDAKKGSGTVENVSANIVSRLEMSKQVKRLLGAVKINYPILLDPEGVYFAKVAKAKLPRIYVLDAAGKIVWFDVGFSETSREHLKRTLEFMFGSSEPAQK